MSRERLREEYTNTAAKDEHSLAVAQVQVGRWQALDPSAPGRRRPSDSSDLHVSPGLIVRNKGTDEALIMKHQNSVTPMSQAFLNLDQFCHESTISITLRGPL